MLMAYVLLFSAFILDLINGCTGWWTDGKYVKITFARYLRDNIDIMQDDKLIPFSKELQHVKDYVALEQVRFGERIEFVCDIKEKEFNIPPLVLQPIVENAIKHGLTPKKEGGTVDIDSNVGSGTTVTLTIPCKEKKK